MIRNPIFNWYLRSFLSEAVEASLCYFFENWLMKHKIPNLLKPQGTIIHQNSQFYYPSESFSFHHFIMRHPVWSKISHVLVMAAWNTFPINSLLSGCPTWAKFFTLFCPLDSLMAIKVQPHWYPSHQFLQSSFGFEKKMSWMYEFDKWIIA